MKQKFKSQLLSLFLGGMVLNGLSGCGELELPYLMSMEGQTQGTGLKISNLDSRLGAKLALTANRKSTGGTGYCYKYVAQAIHQHLSPFLTGGHAYLAAEQLEDHPRFREIKLQPEQLKNLPAGAVVVWGKGKSESGHISIADGYGYEISDHTAPQMTSHYGGGRPRVFVPVRSAR